MINPSPFIRGPTADTFSPSRWEGAPSSLPSSARSSGMPGTLATFGSGPGVCIGQKFAVVEFKALLCALLARLRFECVQGWEVQGRENVVAPLRPQVVRVAPRGCHNLLGTAETDSSPFLLALFITLPHTGRKRHRRRPTSAPCIKSRDIVIEAHFRRR